MKLSNYLKEENESGAAFARRVSSNRSTISLLCAGKRLPSLGLALRIAEQTKGKVGPKDWVIKRTAFVMDTAD